MDPKEELFVIASRSGNRSTIAPQRFVRSSAFFIPSTENSTRLGVRLTYAPLAPIPRHGSHADLDHIGLDSASLGNLGRGAGARPAAWAHRGELARQKNDVLGCRKCVDTNFATHDLPGWRETAMGRNFMEVKGLGSRGSQHGK